MRHLATKEKPKESGWYLWWDLDSDVPYYKLAKIRQRKEKVFINFDFHQSFDGFEPIDNIRERLWLKVS